MNVHDLIPEPLLAAALEDGLVRQQRHPTEPLTIYNYTEKAAYDRVWDAATLNCRGLIVRDDGEIVARPWPKFFNHGEPGAPELDLAAPCRVFDKLDGSLGILYPRAYGWAIATRGSFTSMQAIEGTRMLHDYVGAWVPDPALTYLFEVIFPGNRIVVDYGAQEKLVLLDVIETDTGKQAVDYAWATWPGEMAEEFDADTLAAALAAPPRPNAEGIVVRYESGEMVKVKQDDYVAMHRIITGLNARNVWEVVAVQSCREFIEDRKHWGTYLGIDPARAEEVMALGEDWLAGVPDEFFEWVESVRFQAQESVQAQLEAAGWVIEGAVQIDGRRERYAFVQAQAPKLATNLMRILGGEGTERQWQELTLRAWREACPEPTEQLERYAGAVRGQRVHRCPKCKRDDGLWAAVEVSGWVSLDEHLNASGDHEVDDWGDTYRTGDGGCSECGWEGALSALEVLGWDGEPLPVVAHGQLRIEAA